MYVYIYIHIYIYMCVCACLCESLCVRVVLLTCLRVADLVGISWCKWHGMDIPLAETSEDAFLHEPALTRQQRDINSGRRV